MTSKREFEFRLLSKYLALVLTTVICALSSGFAKATQNIITPPAYSANGQPWFASADAAGRAWYAALNFPSAYCWNGTTANWIYDGISGGIVRAHTPNFCPYYDGTMPPDSQGIGWASSPIYVLQCQPQQKWVNSLQQCVPVQTITSALKKRDCECQQKPVDPQLGHPFYPFTGIEEEIVDTRFSVGWISLDLTYSSSRFPAVDNTNGVPLPLISDAPGFGVSWLSSLHRQLFIQSNLLGAQAARGDGKVISFIGNGSGTFTQEADGIDSLTTTSNGGYLLVDRAKQVEEQYNSAGQLLSMTHLDGKVLSFTYSTGATNSNIAPAAGYLLNAQDQFGRALQFSYALPTGATSASSGGLVQSITDTRGENIAISYDINGNLVSLKWPDASTLGLLYENTNFPYALTGEIDENGSRYWTVGYDAAGRAISSVSAGGVDSYSVTYGSPPQVQTVETLYPNIPLIVDYTAWEQPAGIAVTTPNGSVITMGAAVIFGSPLPTSQSKPAGSGAAASSLSYGFDANSNLSSQLDYNNSLTCYNNDQVRNLETSRVEGLSQTTNCPSVVATGVALPAGSRKTSTAWHPFWRLETQVAEPGRLTTSVYNGQPDPFNGGAVASCAPSGAVLPDGQPIAVLCKRVQQATTDVDGHLGFGASPQSGVSARVEQWTYNSYGQVLTYQDPLTHTTISVYYTDTSFTGTDPNAVGHTIGDLKTVTNAANQTTTYNLFDKNGRLLRSTDPNGVQTVNTYDPRGRPLSTSVGGQTMSFAYDLAGQLKQVTQPDQSWIGYEYDAAHRRTAVKDSLGNRIEFTLDNAGNVIAQNVKDPSGNLARSLSQSFDALGRVQQSTGLQP